MFILFVTVFMIVLYFLVSPGVQSDMEEEYSFNSSQALHMMIWHSESHRICAELAGGCSTGIVNPAADLPATVRNAPAFSLGRFRSHFDSASGTLITYLLADTARYRPGVVSSSMTNIPRGYGATVGYWASPTREAVIIGRPVTTSSRVSMPFATFIPDGAPVIFSNP